MLSKEAVKEFKEIYERKFKEKLSEKESYRLAMDFLNLYRAVYDSPSIENLKEMDYNELKGVKGNDMKN